MIAEDFAYYKPQTLDELTKAVSQAKKPFAFYSGGSEIISMSRVGSISPKSVIDVKAIPDFRGIRLLDGVLTIGAASTLEEIVRDGRFPLLSATVARIADHTNQCRITLGGNVAGTIVYREAVLPLLLTDAEVTLNMDGQTRIKPLRDVFDKRIKLSYGETIVGFHIDEKYLTMPWVHAKRTRGDKIDYPVVTIAAIKTPGGMRFGLSGVTGYPFRDQSLEKIMNDSKTSAEDRAERIVECLPDPPVNDILAKADWRAFQTRLAIENAINRLEGSAK